MQPSRFENSGPGKVGWTGVDVKDMAFALRRGLPMGVMQVLSGKDWAGGPLVQLDDCTSTAAANDLIVNFCWIRPFVEKFRDRVPSSFFIADSILALDRLFMNRLLVPLQAGDTRQSLACEEAKKVKNLIGALRGLWRSSALDSGSDVR